MIPSIVIGELWHGFLLGGKYQQNAELLHEFLSENCVQVHEVGAETAKHYAMLLSHLHKQGTPIPTNDIWIAACCFECKGQLIRADGHFLHLPQISKIVE